MVLVVGSTGLALGTVVNKAFVATVSSVLVTVVSEVFVATGNSELTFETDNPKTTPKPKLVNKAANTAIPMRYFLYLNHFGDSLGGFPMESKSQIS